MVLRDYRSLLENSYDCEVMSQYQERQDRAMARPVPSGSPWDPDSSGQHEISLNWGSSTILLDYSVPVFSSKILSSIHCFFFFLR
jgi:hypothetical protein